MNSHIIVKSKEGNSSTTGSIIVKIGAVRKEIKAVVFSENESIRLKAHIDKICQSS